jgi:Winged helix DNA-binding domain
VTSGAGPTLTGRALNRALLARQMLLERAPVTVPEGLDRMAGLQAQYAPAMYVGLWSRVDGLARADVTGALERRTAVQGTLLRSTIHLVSATDYWPFAAGVRQARRDWFLRSRRGDPSAAEMEQAAQVLREALADGPLRQTAIDTLIGPQARLGIGLWLDLVRVPPSGTWERRRADLYTLAEEWLEQREVTEDEGIELLVRRYLAGFGPATRSEIASWAGLPVGAVAPVLSRLALRRFTAEDGAELVDLPDAPLPDPDIPAPVRFLPVWDATLLVHARRARILPEEFRPRVFHTKNPHSVNTVLVDGAVAGTWRYADGRVSVEEFVPLDRATRRAVAEEGERLAAFHS